MRQCEETDDGALGRLECSQTAVNFNNRMAS